MPPSQATQYDKPVRSEGRQAGRRCGTASPCESVISFTSLIDSRPFSRDYTGTGKGKRRKGEGLKRNEEQKKKRRIFAEAFLNIDSV
jgi:hypothetical protein